LGILDLLLGRSKKPSGLSKRKEKCPFCNAELRLDMKKCPKCGKPLSKLFELLCPACGEHVAFGKRRCPKCGFDFDEPAARPKETFRCPRCGYQANYFMLRCPSCGVKFA